MLLLERNSISFNIYNFSFNIFCSLKLASTFNFFNVSKIYTYLILLFSAAFIRVVGSEFVQKYLGEGPRMVRDVFRLAKENSPAIIFIDEIDAIATKRFDAQTGADREVQRILLELLNQMDGFDQTTNVKVIMATNRADTLDPALLRPGRLDRKIEFPLPDRRQKRLVFSTITTKMNLSEEVDLEDYVARPDRISGADINAICQEVMLRLTFFFCINIFLIDIIFIYTYGFKLLVKFFSKYVGLFYAALKIVLICMCQTDN